MTRRVPTLYQVVVAAIVLFFVLPYGLAWVQALRQSGQPQDLPLGNIEASAVYQADDGSLRMLRVMKHSTEREDVFQILHNDLQARQLIGEPQRVTLPRDAYAKSAQMRVQADGQMALVLNGRDWWQWSRERSLFEPMNAALIQRFSGQLATGVAKLAFGSQREPDLLDITSNTGDRYAVYWRTGEIYPWGGQQQRLLQRPWGRYSQTVERIDYADFRTDVARYGLPSTLVHYRQKLSEDEFQQLPLLEVHSTSDAVVRAAPKRYQAVSDGYVVARQSLQEAGITDIAWVASVPVQFSGEVLARNADRILMRYEETPTTPAEVVLQMVDVHSLQPVWSQATSTLPQMLAGGYYVAAHPWKGGFYLVTTQNLPALVIDNAGKTLFDFQPQKRE
ncbi:hypothetical protein HNP33_000440 [Comamonas odontotermitis]|uniref:Regulatory protein YycH domain-containing protein n=1 Tax=Comamonas odontotermitis TaxID=379895 RepID=A0ABR6RB55_9BURK|nr:hypothetical protein [Comamonas odontotermitis]MBB6576392.1 hypothetical protein [Comamonas odontotermitis]